MSPFSSHICSTSNRSSQPKSKSKSSSQQQQSRPFPATPYLHAPGNANASKSSLSSDNPVASTINLSNDPFARYSLLYQSSLLSLNEVEPRTNLDRQSVPSDKERSRKVSNPKHTHPYRNKPEPPLPNMRPSPLNPTPPAWAKPETPTEGYETHSSAPKSPRRPIRMPRTTNGILEETEELDQLYSLRGTRSKDFKQSSTTVSSRKADKLLGLDPEGQLASLYLVSGLGKDPAQWSRADTDNCRGIQPLEDSLGGGIFWRPDMLGNTFSGDREDRPRKESKVSNISDITSPLRREVLGKALPDAGPDGASRLVAKTIKFAHPRDVEVVNSTLAPPTTCHAFTFTIPRHNTLQAVAQTQAPRTIYDSPYNYTSMVDTQLSSTAIREARTQSDLVFHGVTLTVWTHADKERCVKLREIKHALEKGAGSTRSNSTVRPRRKPMPWMGRNSGIEDSMSDSDGQRKDRISSAPSLPSDAAAAYDEPGDVFWMPYAITLVSRHPVYDVLQDYLRLSWARYSKNAKAHMLQISRILNHETPRPGELYRLPVGMKPEDEVTVEAIMPGALDFDKGLVKVDFQLWPFFQALEVDHIITCMEIALSNSGRVIFCSRHPAMLNMAVGTLKYIVELRGWNGIALPIIHARDSTFTIEDPGPYIIGISTECRYLLTLPDEVLLVDLDTNSIACKSPPAGVLTPREKRTKVKAKIIAALGPDYPRERSVPVEFKVSYPKGVFRNFNRFLHGPERPHYLGERLRPPGWWRQSEVITVFDKIMADKHKKPSLIQRLTKSGMNRPQAQLTVGEQLAKTMMRRRALHYVETRDDLELKVARINRRLLKLVEEGDHWKQQFETFEKYADKLAQEANELKVKIDRERREARRLSNVATEQSKANIELQEKLTNTENARAEAMRQLSDMHQSIQDLEKEREEIMNIIEAQITEALDATEDQSESGRAETPTSVLSSPRVKAAVRIRPGTKDSNRSGLSRYAESQTVSVLGAFRGKPSKSLSSRDPLAAVDKSILDKSEGIAERVALIQAKLELALVHHRSISGSTADLSDMGDTSEDDRDEHQFDNAETPTLSQAGDFSDHTHMSTSVSESTIVDHDFVAKDKELSEQPSMETIHTETIHPLEGLFHPLPVPRHDLIVDIQPTEEVPAKEERAVTPQPLSVGLGLIRSDSGMRLRPKRRISPPSGALVKSEGKEEVLEGTDSDTTPRKAPIPVNNNRVSTYSTETVTFGTTA